MPDDLSEYMERWLDEHLATSDQAMATRGLDLAMRFSEDANAAGFSNNDVNAVFGPLPVFMQTKLDAALGGLKLRPTQGNA